MTHVALTIIGDDRPGLVSTLATVVTAHDGNWQESQLARLAGKFAGVVVAEIPEAQFEAFSSSLEEVRASGLTVTMVQVSPSPAEGEVMSLHLVGNDRPGIVAQISRALAGLGVTIDSLEARTTEAPMAGGLLFLADALVRLPETVAAEDVRKALEPIASELMVDLDVAAL